MRLLINVLHRPAGLNESQAFWADFDAEFGAEIASFPLDGHWYYSKEMDIGN